MDRWVEEFWGYKFFCLVWAVLTIFLIVMAIWAPEEEWYHGSWQDDEQCETDMECIEVCLKKLPPNRPESECDDFDYGDSYN